MCFSAFVHARFRYNQRSHVTMQNRISDCSKCLKTLKTELKTHVLRFVSSQLINFKNRFFSVLCSCFLESVFIYSTWIVTVIVHFTDSGIMIRGFSLVCAVSLCLLFHFLFCLSFQVVIKNMRHNDSYIAIFLIISLVCSVSNCKLS